MNTRITFTQAAAVLGVTARTIKRWMRRPEIREALSAVRFGKQWHIPCPKDICWEEADGTWRKLKADIVSWEWVTRRKLEAIGIKTPRGWERDLERKAEKSAVRRQDIEHLYLACCTKALAHGRITKKAKLAIDLICDAALKIVSRNKYQELVQIKGMLPRQLWRYWPRKCDFELVMDASSSAKIEELRQNLDFTNAARKLHRRCKPGTGENLRLLVHQDWTTDINDTGEKLSKDVLDFRTPQNGLSLRQFRKRHPLRKSPQNAIILRIKKLQTDWLGAGDKAYSGKTPARGSKAS